MLQRDHHSFSQRALCAVFRNCGFLRPSTFCQIRRPDHHNEQQHARNLERHQIVAEQSASPIRSIEYPFPLGARP